MSVAQHVHRRGGIDHLRCRVPLDLLSLIGRVEIRRSLATACPKEAKQRANRLYGRLGIIFEGLRRMPGVKTENSVRNVPIHSVLVGFGFVDLFDKAKAGQRIWPELLPTGRMKKFGDTYSSHFTDYRHRCGLYERFMDFHSLRRTFSPACEPAPMLTP